MHHFGRSTQKNIKCVRCSQIFDRNEIINYSHGNHCIVCAIEKSKIRRPNEYITLGDISIIITERGEEIIIDSSDLEKCKQYKWSTDSNGYPRTNTKNLREYLFIHQLISNSYTNNKIIVDHKNLDKLDNRKENLRICSASQNNMNKKIQMNNTSGIRGISWHKIHNKWQSSISINGKTIYLGIFSNISDAIKFRQEAETKYFGEYKYNKDLDATIKT